MTGDMAGAKVAAAQVVRLDPNWSVEKYLSDGGGYPDDVAMLFIEGASQHVCRWASFRQCRTLFISRRATRRGFTKPLAKSFKPAHQSSAPHFCKCPLVAPSGHPC